MAYTKAPSQDTHNVLRIPVSAEPILTSSTTTFPTSSISVNCFALKESQWATDPVNAIHTRQGFTSAIAANSITTSGLLGHSSVQAYGSLNVFFARGAYGYLYTYSTGAIASWATSAGVLASGVYTNFIDSTNARRVAIIDSGSILFACLEDGSSGTSTSLAGIGITNSAGLVFINGYLFAVNSTGTRIYNSAPSGVYTTWNSTDYLDAEQYADPIRYIDKHKNYLVAFGSSSIEFFYDNAIEVGSPLARQESYSTRIGIVMPQITDRTLPPVARIEDDLYFIGISEQGSRQLFRIRDFKVDEIKNQYILNILNNGYNEYAGLTTQVINGNPNIVIEFYSSSVATKKQYAYLPSEDYVWKIEGGDQVSYIQRIGLPITPLNIPYGTDTLDFLTLFVPDTGYVYASYPDITYAVSVSAYTYTEVIDLGVNRYKHLARVDAIGDYSDTLLTLSYIPSQNYAGTAVSCGSQTSSTIGEQNNISWYNLGAFRRFILVFAMNGAKPAIHRGLEIEYNIGVA